MWRRPPGKKDSSSTDKGNRPSNDNNAKISLNWFTIAIIIFVIFVIFLVFLSVKQSDQRVESRLLNPQGQSSEASNRVKPASPSSSVVYVPPIPQYSGQLRALSTRNNL